MKRKILALAMAFVVTLGTCSYVGAEERAEVPSSLLAFEGAEGGGRFTSGGRGGEVYIVTSLEDYDPETEKPIKGTLRDAVSGSNRIIVFNVSGVITLKDTLRISSKNLTIAGQTAPGDGITVTGYDTNISNAENIIIRYMRFRPGADNIFDGDSMDAIWGRSAKNVMVDHVSTSWSTDETMSIYRCENMTVQWSIVAESLTMSGHTKGRHGYGAIMGGYNTTYHHNLIANHTSRNPRMGGGTPEADDNDHIALFDLVNNVIYNWGFNGCYGGGRAQINFMNNYLKAGPGTRDSVENQIIDAGEGNKPGYFYVNGNVLEGNSEVTNDNSLGIKISDAAADWTEIVDTKFQMDGNSAEALTVTDAETAYNEVIEKAGATYPKRDALDARILTEVKNGTGQFANRHEDVGGLPYTESVVREESWDTDNDGIPDSWESANGLDPNDPTDSVKIAENGYANIENYFNSIVDMENVPSNPVVSISNLENNAIVKPNIAFTVEASAESENGIAKVDFYIGEEIVSTATKAPYSASLTLEDGSYNISVKATDSLGNQTQSDKISVHANSENKLTGYTSKDIGEPAVEGAAYSLDGEVVVKGSGKISGTDDNFHYVYKTLSGNGEITAKLDYITPVDNHAFAGVMIRETADTDSKAVALGISHTKAYEWKETNALTGKTETLYRNAFGAYLVGRYETGGEFDLIDENLDSLDAAEASGVALVKDIAFKNFDVYNGYYLKLVRKGDTFTAYVSAHGTQWTEVGSRTVEMKNDVLIGFAVDANKQANDIDNYNTAKFSEITIK
ncbi:MAG: Ig-like domain-containing protein [Clostridiales bacterium]|nr:Ig-like domain-containing protein [Clostridiales bacterium]